MLEFGKILRLCSTRWILIYGIIPPFFTAIAFFYILGVARYITDVEENTCDMTYMFEYPQYVRISLDNDIEEKYPRFGLYAYGEGYLTGKLRRMYFSGIPVLFIPGNAGSHEQVRSIASVSLRKGIKDLAPFSFDFFTISFNKDYSALYGGVLMEQTMYVSHCIKAILDLYKNRMDNVILIGHSMGGIIAKGALVLTPDINASYASMIINLATPSTPALVLDRTFANYYHELEKRLHQIKDAGVNVVSIGGGPRDILVTASQTYDRTADLNVLSTSIPAVWKSTDHLSILWCKQLVFAIVRSLFDAVACSKGLNISMSNPDIRMRSLLYHFQEYNLGRKLHDYCCQAQTQFEANSEWVNITHQQYVWHNKIGSKKQFTVYLAIELPRESDTLTIDAINLESKNWLFVCSASSQPPKAGNQRICESGWDLTGETRLLPDPIHRSRRTIDLNLRKISYPNITHVVVRVTAHDLEKYITVNFDSYFYNSRVVSTKNRPLQSKYLFGFRESSLIETGKGSVRYYVTLPDITDAVTVQLKSLMCTYLKHSAVVELLEARDPGSMQSRFFTHKDNSPKTMKIQTLHVRRSETASLTITLDPSCTYEINVQSAGIIDKISCRIRNRWPLLYIIIISILILFVSIRLHNGPDTFPTIVVTIILSFIFATAYEACIALCIIGLSAIGVCCSIIFFGSVAHGIAARFLARVISFSTTWSDWLLNCLNQLPFITTVFVLSLILTTCGGLAMLISVFLYFLKLTKMYENYLEGILFASLQHFNWYKRLKSAKEEENDRSSSQEIYDHLILFLLWSFAAIPAVPSVLVWAKNFSYNMRLTTEDPVLLSCWAILSACSILGMTQLSHNKETRSLILSYVLRLTSWIVLSMTAASRPFFYHWCMPPIVTGVVTLITLNAVIP